jgi:hypothetical protein
MGPKQSWLVFQLGTLAYRSHGIYVQGHILLPRAVHLLAKFIASLC